MSKSIGTCAFAFTFYPINTTRAWSYHYGKRFEPYLYAYNGVKSCLYNATTYGCALGTGAYCTAIIKENGWKIPKDYPRKIKY